MTMLGKENTKNTGIIISKKKSPLLEICLICIYLINYAMLSFMISVSMVVPQFLFL